MVGWELLLGKTDVVNVDGENFPALQLRPAKDGTKVSQVLKFKVLVLVRAAEAEVGAETETQAELRGSA